MKDMPRKTVKIYSGNVFGRREWGTKNEAIGIESFCNHCEQYSNGMLIELGSFTKSPYPSQDLSVDQIRKLIKLLEDAL